MPSSRRTAFAGLGVVVLWASAFPAIRVAAPQLGVLGLSLVRLFVAAALLIVLAPILKVRWPARDDVVLILGCGLFGMAAYQVLLNWGELYVPAGTASLIIAAAPLVSVAIAVGVFGEHLTAIKLAGSAVAIAGVVIVSVSRSDISASSAAWLLIAATVVQGIYHPLTRPLLRRYSGLEVATYAMAAGALMLVPAVPFAWSALSTADAGAWWAAAYLGILPSALGFVLWGHVVALLPVATSTSLLYLVPPVAVLIAWAWLGEVPDPEELLGGAVVLLGVITLSRGDRLRRQIKDRRLSRNGRSTAVLDAQVDRGLPHTRPNGCP